MLQCSAVCSRVGKKYDVCTCLQQERGSGTEWNEDSKLVELEDVHSSSEKQASDVTQSQSPLLVAKAARNSEILLRNSLDVSLEVSNHSVSSSTIFVPVNEDSSSVSVSIKSGRAGSYGSLASIGGAGTDRAGSYGSLASIGGASPLIVGTPAPSVLRLLEEHDDEMKLSLSQQAAAATHSHGPLHGDQGYILNN